MANIKSHPTTWSRDGFLISTDTTLIPRSSLNEAFASEQLYWSTRLPPDVLETIIESSLCFGLYAATASLPGKTETPDTSTGQEAADVVHEIAGHVRPTDGQSGATSKSPAVSDPTVSPDSKLSDENSQQQPALIGFARLVTDYVTLCYLTDVYILPEWQGTGLGTWLIQCVQETIDQMPHLRRSVALTGGGEKTITWYHKLMGMSYTPGEKGEVGWLWRKGRGAVV